MRYHDALCDRKAEPRASASSLLVGDAIAAAHELLKDLRSETRREAWSVIRKTQRDLFFRVRRATAFQDRIAS